MYHDRPTFSLVKWSDEDVDEYSAGLETEEGVHAVSAKSPFSPPPMIGVESVRRADEYRR